MFVFNMLDSDWLTGTVKWHYIPEYFEIMKVINICSEFCQFESRGLLRILMSMLVIQDIIPFSAYYELFPVNTADIVSQLKFSSRPQPSLCSCAVSILRIMPNLLWKIFVNIKIFKLLKLCIRSQCIRPVLFITEWDMDWCIPGKLCRENMGIPLRHL